MAVTHVKVTYSVQPRTAQRVQELATKWGVPKSEVIRRAVDQATSEKTTARNAQLEAYLEFKKLPPLFTPAEADRLCREVRLSRRASGRHRG